MLLSGGPRSKAQIAMALGQARVSGQLNKVIRGLIAAGRIAYTLPHKPNSRLQAYRLVESERNA